jgi:hypothetical protein
MPSMPVYFVGKGRQFKVIDDQFNTGSSAVYDDALNRIKTTPSLADLARRHVTSSPMTDGDVDHLRDDWFGSWWPKLPVEDVLRAGYAEAITRARNRGLPIESLWVCAKEGEFQVYICEGDHQVTVIVFTPPPPRHRPLSRKRRHSDEQLTEDEPIWVVKKKDRWDDEYTKQGASDYTWADEANQIIKRRIRYAGAP